MRTSRGWGYCRGKAAGRRGTWRRCAGWAKRGGGGRGAGGSLARGFVLTLDYGYEAAELFAPWRKDGTLLCFYRHNASGDPYARLGRQDMTSHVDFTSLRQAGEEAGLRPLGVG